MAFANAQEAAAALAAQSASLADLREIVTRFPQLRPIVAAYPQTDQPLVEWLGSLRDPLIDAQLAKRSSSAGLTPPQARIGTSAWTAASEGADATRPATPLSSVPSELSGPMFGLNADNSASSGEPLIPVEKTVGQPPIQGYPGGPSAAPPSYPADYGYSKPGPTPTPGPAHFAMPPIPPGPPPTTRQPKAATPRAGRRVLPAVLVTLLALALVGGGLGVAFATGLLGGSDKAASKAVASTVAPPSSPEAPASSSAPTTSAPVAPTTTAPPVPAATTCWDGSRSADGTACPAPSGEEADWAYLQYVYPSIATQPNCTQRSSATNAAYSELTVMWECELGDALIRYRYWESNADADMHYGEKFTKKTTLATYDPAIGGTPVKGWIKTDKKTANGPNGIKRVVLTMWLPDQHLSMSVEGNTKATMWAALDLVRIRPSAQSLGYLEGTEPDEAAIAAMGR